MDPYVRAQPSVTTCRGNQDSPSLLEREEPNLRRGWSGCRERQSRQALRSGVENRGRGFDVQ
jgi:hypothetical protein